MMMGLACQTVLPSKGGRRRERPCAGSTCRRPAASTRHGLVEVVVLAGVEVVGAMRGCGVDRAGALVGGDVGREDAEDAAIEEWVLEGGALELRCL